MIVFLYILKDYLKYVLGTVILTVFLFVLFDFIQRSGKDFADYSPATIDIARFYLLQVPAQAVQALPIAALLASVISMILLSRTNEVTAMRAAGMSPMQIGMPLAAGGFALSVTALVVGEFALPNLAKQSHYVYEVRIQKQKDDQNIGGAHWLRDGQSLVNFQEFDPDTNTLRQVQVIQLTPNFRPAQAMEAATATFRDSDRGWELQNSRILKFKRNGTLDSVVSPTTPPVIHLPVEPQKLSRDRRKPNELSIRELRDQVERGDVSGANTLGLKVELQGKLAYPFAAFVVSLIGLKFGYKSERATETAKGILMAFAIGISYWFILSIARAVGLRGDIHPFLAAWMANVVILLIIAADWWIARRST